ncbi:MAG: hypothetical protein AABZ84_04665 [Pseudomonadota bacterium]
MNISTRITEYSITGGLLWVNGFLFITLLNLQVSEQAISLGHALRLWSEWIRAMTPLTQALAPLSPSLQASIGTLLAALAIVIIFFSGILLDLLSPMFFISFEMLFFQKWLISKNRTWLDRLVADNRDFIEEDYRCFINTKAFNWRRPLAWFERRRCYNKLWTFLFSHIMVFSNAAGLDELMDRVHLWRTSRAISTSMVVLGCLMNFTPLVHVSLDRDTALNIALTAVGVPLVLFAVSALITLGTYSRMCVVLCALAYSTVKKQSAESAG